MVRLDEGGRAASNVRLLAPHPALRDWVQHASIQPGPTGSRPWRVVPDTCPHIIFTVTSTGSRCRIVGARRTFADIDVVDRLMTIAVRLQPGALPAVIRDDAWVLTDRSVNIEDVFGAAGRRLMDELSGLSPVSVAARLMDATDARVRGRIASGFARVLWRAVRVSAMEHQLHLSARALHTRAVRDLGLAPKRALRIERLHAALRAAASGDRLVSAALKAGYSDQAHLTREIGSLLGEPPTAWRRRARADSFKSLCP